MDSIGDYNYELLNKDFSTVEKVKNSCEDCSDKEIMIAVLRGFLASKDKLVLSLQKDKKDDARLINLLRNQKQILSDKNFELRSGNTIPKTVQNRIVYDSLKGKYSNMTLNLSHFFVKRQTLIFPKEIPRTFYLSVHC